MRKLILASFSLAVAASLAKADLVPYLCQEAGSACGATPAFTQLASNSYVYNYSIDLSSVEQINSALGTSSVIFSGLTAVTGATAPTGWTVASFTPTSVTFDPTSTVDGPGPMNFGIFAVDTSVGGGMGVGSYTSSAWKLNGLADSASGDLEVNASVTSTSPVPEPAVCLLLGLGLTGLSFLRRTKSV